MNFSELLSFDHSIELVAGNSPKQIEGISQSTKPLPGTFVFLKNKKFLTSLGEQSDEKNYPQTGLLIQKNFWDQELNDDSRKDLSSRFDWIATLNSVDEGMCKLSKPFYEMKFGGLNFHVDGRQMGTANIDSSAEIAQGVFIGEQVEIAEDVTIMPGCVILPRVKIGKGTIVFPNVTIYPFTQIGEKCRIHSASVIGADGFGYHFFEGKHQKIWHLAGVIIDDEVEIGANSMIDAGAFSPTFVGEGTKIDNDVQIAHNAKIHKHVIFCGTAGVAGSVEVGDYCAFGAGSGLAQGVKMGERAQLAARAVVSENTKIPAGDVLAGHPARPLRDWMRSQATLRKLTKK